MIKVYKGSDLLVSVSIVKDDLNLYQIPVIRVAPATPNAGEVMNIYALVRSDDKLQETYVLNTIQSVPTANVLTAVVATTAIGIQFRKEDTKNWTEGTLSIEVIFDLYDVSLGQSVKRETYLQKNLGYILASSGVFLA
jgi:hypothetical protein